MPCRNPRQCCSWGHSWEASHYGASGNVRKKTISGGSMRHLRDILATSLAILMAALPGSAANHREAPITALDHKADITDIYAFRSYDGGGIPRVTMILCVDPLQEPANGPNWSPFDPDLLYEMKIDNNN